MKKYVFYVWIFLVGLVVTAGMLVGNTLLYVFITTDFLLFYPLSLVVPFLAAFGTAGLYKKADGKYHMKAWVFWLLAFMPQFIIGADAAAAAIYLVLFDVKYNGVWTFWFNYYFFAVVGLTYGISGAIFTFLAAKKLKRLPQ